MEEILTINKKTMKQEALDHLYAKLFTAKERQHSYMNQPLYGINEEQHEIVLSSVRREIEKFKYMIKIVEEHGTD